MSTHTGTAWQSHAMRKALVQYRCISDQSGSPLDNTCDWSTKLLKMFVFVANCIICISNTCLNLCFFFYIRRMRRKRKEEASCTEKKFH